MLEVNKIYCEDHLITMSKMPDDFVDLTVTSPPYDNLRDYKGYTFQFEKMAKELYRVTKPGGVVVWVVNDETIDFCESLSSSKQKIFFVEQCNFNLLDTMIYGKKSYAPAYPNMMRYAQVIEYMFILSKGKPKTFNTIQIKKADSTIFQNKGNSKLSKFRQKDGSFRTKRISNHKFEKADCNLWIYDTGNEKSTHDKLAFNHPAIFPEQLAADHIFSWSNEGDLVYDPMAGSGTVPKMAIKMNRNWIASEISQEYVDIAEKRIKIEQSKLRFQF